MAHTCDICGRGTQVGNAITRRGLAKSKGGVGKKITGKSKRTYKVNIQKIRVYDDNGVARKMKVCTKCIRSGKVKKRVS
jgi:large subunit ribosomal protein L28